MNDKVHSRPVVLVTGAVRGIGAATAIALAKRGATPVLAVRDPDAATELIGTIAAIAPDCRAERCDVSDYSSVTSCVQTSVERFGRLDAIINNAGRVDPQGLIGDTDPAEWATALSVNLLGAYHVAHAALPALLRSKGAVVNVSTGAAHAARRGWSAYCSAKSGLLMFTRCLLSEYTEQGLSTYSLQPGLVDTAMQAGIRDKGVNEISQVPQSKLDPPELSASILAWLALTKPRDLMGVDLSVADPGLLARAEK